MGPEGTARSFLNWASLGGCDSEGETLKSRICPLQSTEESGGGRLGGDLACLSPPSKENSEGMGSAWW